MSVHILIPTALRAHTQQQSSVEVDARTVQEALQKLVVAYPDLKSHIMAEGGKVRSFINVFVNEDDIRQKSDLKTPVKSGDEISIVPSIAGGAISKDKVMELLSTCYDPEIPVNIVDLGLIYDVAISPMADKPDKDQVHVKMTLTAPGCPEAPKMQVDTEAKLATLEGVGAAKVEFVWEPQWTPDKMSEAARLELGMT